MKKTEKNKRGDVPIVVLVIGVVAICILAIVSFYISDRNAKKSFDIEIVERAAIMGEKVQFYQESLGFSEDETNTIFGVRQDGLGKHIILEQEGVRVRYNIP